MLSRRSSPFDEMFDVFRSFDNLFRRTLDEYRGFPETGQRLLTSGGQESLAPRETGWMGQFWPAVECFSHEKNLVVRVELPGVEPGDVEVSVTGTHLTIKGQKQVRREKEEPRYHLQETAHGQFERRFMLPEGVRAEQIKATFENGVLEIVLPVEETKGSRKVPIDLAEGGKKSVKAA